MEVPPTMDMLLLIALGVVTVVVAFIWATIWTVLGYGEEAAQAALASDLLDKQVERLWRPLRLVSNLAIGVLRSKLATLSISLASRFSKLGRLVPVTAITVAGGVAIVGLELVGYFVADLAFTVMNLCVLLFALVTLVGTRRIVVGLMNYAVNRTHNAVRDRVERWRNNGSHVS